MHQELKKCSWENVSKLPHPKKCGIFNKSQNELEMHLLDLNKTYYSENLKENKVAIDQVAAVESDLISDYFCDLEHKRWNNFEYMNNFIFEKELYVLQDGKWKPTSSDATLKFHLVH